MLLPHRDSKKVWCFVDRLEKGKAHRVKATVNFIPAAGQETLLGCFNFYTGTLLKKYSKSLRVKRKCEKMIQQGSLIVELEIDRGERRGILPRMRAVAREYMTDRIP